MILLFNGVFYASVVLDVNIAFGARVRHRERERERKGNWQQLHMSGVQLSNHEEESGEWEFHANGNSMKTADVEAKLHEGNIQEAESSLREGLSLNSEVILLLFYTIPMLISSMLCNYELFF